VSPSEKRQGVTRQLDVRPLHIIAFETEPGNGCERPTSGCACSPVRFPTPNSGSSRRS
jgi:hypothetical protein